MHKIWIHDESLGLARNMDSFFILDWKFFTSRAWSAKRIYFVLSVLRNSGVQIIEGDTLEVLTNLRNTGQDIRVAHAKDPYLAKIIVKASSEHLVEIDNSFKPQWLEPVWQDKDLKRFSRFWNRVRKQL